MFNNTYFKEIVIMKSDGYVLKSSIPIDYLPKVNDLIYVGGKQYRVTSNVFNYDLQCINIWVAPV